jgi:hypothetical protein
MMQRIPILNVLLLFSLMLISNPIFAQGEATATIRGTVKDSVGAVIPDATVTLRHLDTELTRTTTTDANGDYVFQRVDVGRYELNFEQAGFWKLVRTGITLRVNDVALIDVTMEVGEITEAVVVEADAPVVESGKMDLGGVVDSRRVVDLPLNGRAFNQLIFLQPGVLSGNPGGSGQGSGQFVNGARATVNNFLVDGGSQNDPQVPFGQAGSFFGPDGISVDAIQEFRVITSNADAEFGRSSGAQVNIITKSGTNEFHGSAFAFHRNDDLDARNFFDPEKTGEFKQNNFGFGIGGPIYFPNRREGHYFFGNYEGFRQRRANNITVGVPNADLIRLIPGDLGRLFRATFVETGIVPSTGNPAQTFSFQPLSDTDRQRLEAQGRAIAGNPGVASLILPFPDNQDQDQFLVRTDHQLRPDNKLSVRYNFSEGDTPGGALGGDVPGFRFGFFGRQQAVTITDDHIFNPNLVNTFRFNYNRNRLDFPLESTPAPLRALGFGEGDATTGPPTLVSIATGIDDFGQPNNMPQIRVSNEFQWSDTLSYTRGRHVMKGGGDIRRIQSNDEFSALLRPQVVFSGFTGPNGILGPGGADQEPVALQARQFLFGGFDVGPRSGLRGFRLTEYGFFFKDDWKVRPNLTINLGVRYEQIRPLNEANEVLSNLFAVAGGQPIDDAPVGIDNVLSGRVGAFAVGNGVSFTKTDTNNFAPRLGISYDPFGDGKMVFRASYGLFYDRTFGNVVGNVRFAPPFVADALLVNTPFRLGLAPTLADALTPGITAINPDASTPYTQRWNVTVERELFDQNTVVRASYVGSKGTNLIRTILPNLGASGIPVASRPNPNFTTITLRDTSGQSIYHAFELEVLRRMSKGLTFQAAYTVSKSIDDVSGEIAAGIDSAVPQAPITNLGAPNAIGPFGPGQIFADRGLSVFDARQRLVINYIYELPFGPGRTFLSSVGGVPGKLLEGWSITGITVLQSGSPLTPTTGVDNNRDGTINDRAAALDDPRRALAANSSVATDPSINNGAPTFFLPNRGGGVLGDPADPIDITQRLTRGAFHGPGLSNFDFALRKQTFLNSVKEGMNVEFRAEFFNIFNHTNFGAPVINIRSPFFGQILSTRAPSREIQFGLKVNF